ncbi:WXG100 family type VII secretion target [Gordonia sp. ABSL1-1]|uniref:WXG100 family type VII secretion target n=1 Tax=Gordonia sp. ABSL1-1 TaxID=3053923 RepID=UPI002573B047|nr:WXG100 family type VII secretion target [Gordonia sp. ABSL1-1]MDL9936717.1 WXG100 family type VII secretion target [Gordonia sp. ABSL1-1]
MSQPIRYDFASLGDLSGGLGASFERLETLNAQLKKQVASLGENWSSQDAKLAYDDAQARFDQIFANSREQLHGLKRGVQNASRIMAERDSTIGAAMRSII